MLGLFGCERSGTREDLCKRLIEYLNEPEKIKSDDASSGKVSK